jgi:hypothetical protein
VQSWIDENASWNGVGWRSDVLATRVFAWIAHFDEIVRRDQDDALRRAMLTSLVAQLRHLVRTASWEVAGAGRVRALKGLIAGMVVLGGFEPRLARVLKSLERELSVEAALAYHDHHVRGVKATRVQCDEIWSFVGAKQKNVGTSKRAGDPTAGDCWTWTALEAETKLRISYQVGGRDAEYALMLMDDLRGRLANRNSPRTVTRLTSAR